MRRPGRATALALAAVLAGCGDRPGDPGATTSADDPVAWFEDVTERSGIDFRHRSGAAGSFWFPEIISGGVCLLDADGDGRLDVYLVQGGSLEPDATDDGPANRLYRNLGDLRFEEITDDAGVGDRSYGMGCTVADYDRDGDDDLYVTNLGSNVLYRNDGDGTFEDVTAFAGVGDERWSTSAAFADLDGDGHLDLFVVNYLNWSHAREIVCDSGQGEREYCSPESYQAPARDTFYRNLGDGTFTDKTSATGLDQAFGNGLGIALGDLDDDGRTDIFVANDATANQLWRARSDGHFEDVAIITGAAFNLHGAPEAGMGVQAIDIDGDDDLDIFLTHLQEESNTLYRNDAGDFTDITADAGLAVPSLGLTGFSLGFADFDHDGLLDLFIANGRVKRLALRHDPDDPYAEPNQVLRGTAPAHYAEVMPRQAAGGFIGSSRGAAFGDLDDDGAIDVVVTNRDQRVEVLRNRIGTAPALTLTVLRRDGTPDLGARVTVESGGRVHRRLVNRAYGYCSSNDPRVHAAVGDDGRATAVTVHWTDGSIEEFGELAAGAHTLRAGAGTATSR